MTSSSTGRTRSIGKTALAVTACVFILGGGTAFGAFVVSSNSQIGPGTVSGHKPPTGKHANIIGGSINATDLASGAVTNGKLGTNSVTAGKIFNGAVLGKKIAAGAVTPTRVGVIPQARAEFTGNQTIPNNAFTDLCFDKTVFDNDGIWGGLSPATCADTAPRTKLIAHVAGVYEVDSSVQWDNDSTGIRVLRLTKNGTSDLATSQITAAAFTANSLSTLVKLDVGDFVQAEVLQNSGGGLAALGAPTTNLSMTWVGHG
jgi:hypothetical protein